MKPLVWGHTARKWPSRDELSSEAEFITTALDCLSGRVRGTSKSLQGTEMPGPSPAACDETTPTRLRRDTAREMHVLKSSGFFLHRQVMRLTAAVTTPCRGRQVAGQGWGGGEGQPGDKCPGCGSESRDPRAGWVMGAGDTGQDPWAVGGGEGIRDGRGGFCTFGWVTGTQDTGPRSLGA